MEVILSEVAMHQRSSRIEKCCDKVRIAYAVHGGALVLVRKQYAAGYVVRSFCSVVGNSVQWLFLHSLSQTQGV